MLKNEQRRWHFKIRKRAVGLEPNAKKCKKNASKFVIKKKVLSLHIVREVPRGNKGDRIEVKDNALHRKAK